jgi:hypothetical protein
MLQGNIDWNVMIEAQHLTIDECQELADSLFEDAAALPPGQKQQEILQLARGYRDLAEAKGWLASKVN